ncbi:MAG: hypothetical protein GX486_07825 [Acetobacter sp.]|nr:hypothetical protein [Acetobacter sp.]
MPAQRGLWCCVIAYRNQLGDVAQYTQRIAAPTVALCAPTQKHGPSNLFVDAQNPHTWQVKMALGHAK